MTHFPYFKGSIYMKKYLRLFILSFVLLRPVPDLLAFEPPPLQGSQKVFYAQNPRGPLGMDSFLSEQGMNKKEFILQRRADEKYSYQVSFSVNSDNSRPAASHATKNCHPVVEHVAESRRNTILSKMVPVDRE